MLVHQKGWKTNSGLLNKKHAKLGKTILLLQTIFYRTKSLSIIIMMMIFRIASKAISLFHLGALESATPSPQSKILQISQGNRRFRRAASKILLQSSNRVTGVAIILSCLGICNQLSILELFRTQIFPGINQPI